MRPFRFRAEVALDLRRKQEQDARVALAALERAQQDADACAARAMSVVGDAQRSMTDAQREGATGWQIDWHRSWIVKCRVDADAHRARAADAAAAVARQAVVVRDAHRKRRTLERLRDRAWRKYQVDAGREDLRDMNNLAGMRHLARAGDHGEQHCDNLQHLGQLQRDVDERDERQPADGPARP